jgi:8-oxo-dGTP pyrophosphatase MutT (NUDIX family)
MPEEKILLNATLCFPVRDTRVLLGVKMKNIGAGCRNGWGGGIEFGETAIECIEREVAEEGGVGVRQSDFDKVALVDFTNHTTEGGVFVCRVHIYLLNRWDGEFQPTKEMADPRWFEKQRPPLDAMMLADRVWVPPVMAGKKLYVQASYGPFQKTLLGDVKIRYIDRLAA